MFLEILSLLKNLFVGILISYRRIARRSRCSIIHKQLSRFTHKIDYADTASIEPPTNP